MYLIICSKIDDYCKLLDHSRMGVTLNGKMILKTDIIPSNQDQYVEITTLCYS